MATENIFTATPATFAGQDTHDTKIDAETRADSDSADYPIAAWANGIDEHFERLNRFAQGTEDFSEVGKMPVFAGDLHVDGDLTVDGVAPGAVTKFTHHHYSSTATTIKFIPFNGTTEQSGQTVYTTWMVAPFAGRLAEVQIWANGNAGSTIVGIHTEENATPEETQTETVGSQSTELFTFVDATHFAKGERLQVSVDTSVGAGQYSIECKWVEV